MLPIPETGPIRPIRPISPIGPIIFGEVLFDVFPDGTRVLGGAPFNVAWHLHALGCQPLFISCVANDELGDEVLARMRAWGMRTDGISLSSTRPTGTVTVSLCDGQPTFTINPDQAYDDIIVPPFDLSSAPLIYCGSLCLRTPQARAQFASLRQRAPAPLFVDVNLRSPWWDKTLILDLLTCATWFKCNLDELRQIADLLHLAGSPLLLASQLLQRFSFRALIVTNGAEGATWYDHDGTICSHQPPPLQTVVDTVGAGDALSAVVIRGLLAHLPTDVILSQAVAFAARICTIRGAVPSDPTFYQPFPPQ